MDFVDKINNRDYFLNKINLNLDINIFDKIGFLNDDVLIKINNVISQLNSYQKLHINLLNQKEEKINNWIEKIYLLIPNRKIKDLLDNDNYSNCKTEIKKHHLEQIQNKKIYSDMINKNYHKLNELNQNINQIIIDMDELENTKKKYFIDTDIETEVNIDGKNKKDVIKMIQIEKKRLEILRKENEIKKNYLINENTLLNDLLKKAEIDINLNNSLLTGVSNLEFILPRMKKDDFEKEINNFVNILKEIRKIDNNNKSVRIRLEQLINRLKNETFREIFLNLLKETDKLGDNLDLVINTLQESDFILYHNIKKNANYQNLLENNSSHGNFLKLLHIIEEVIKKDDSNLLLNYNEILNIYLSNYQNYHQVKTLIDLLPNYQIEMLNYREIEDKVKDLLKINNNLLEDYKEVKKIMKLVEEDLTEKDKNNLIPEDKLELINNLNDNLKIIKLENNRLIKKSEKNNELSNYQIVLSKIENLEKKLYQMSYLDFPPEFIEKLRGPKGDVSNIDYKKLENIYLDRINKLEKQINSLMKINPQSIEILKKEETTEEVKTNKIVNLISLRRKVLRKKDLN